MGWVGTRGFELNLESNLERNLVRFMPRVCRTFCKSCKIFLCFSSFNLEKELWLIAIYMILIGRSEVWSS